MEKPRLSIPHVSFSVLLVVLLVTVVCVDDQAHAQCSPAQMQEANNQFFSAKQFIDAKQWDMAIPRLQSIVEVCPNHIISLRALGLALLETGKLDNALLALSRVIEVRGEASEAPDFANLAKVFTKQKKYAEARAEYMKAQQLAPDDCGVLFNLGVLHNAAGVYTQSVETFEHALSVCPQLKDHVLPQLTKACQNAAKQQRNSGNVEQANRYDELSRQYSGSAGGSTAFDTGKNLMNQGKFNEAASFFQNIVKDNPSSSAAWLNLARCQDQAGQKSASVSAYQKYIEIKPGDLRVAADMILVMIEGRQCTQAQSTAAGIIAANQAKGRKAIAKVNYAWGKALECTEDYAEAKAKFNEYINSGDRDWLSMARTEIERMDGFMAREDAARRQAAQGR